MRLPCEMIQDLLPIYEENLCSDATRAAVEKHLSECEQCRRQAEGMEKLSALGILPESGKEDRAVVRSFRKIRRRWLQSLVGALLICPVLVLFINQFRAEGICFTNLDEIRTVHGFVKVLEKGDYEKASGYIDYERSYRKMQELLIYDPDTDGEGYTTVVLEEEVLVASDKFFEEHLKWEENDRNIWKNIIYNHVEHVMIPEKIFWEVAAEEPDSVKETAEKELIVNGKIYDPYVRLETKWGTYIAAEKSGLKECETALDFCEKLELIPVEMFKEGYPQLEKQAWARYHELQEQYEEAKAMSLEEFARVIRSNCIRDLEYCAKQGITFQSRGYQESYFMSESGEWSVTYGLLVSDGKENVPLSVSYVVRDGKLTLGSTSHGHDFGAYEVVHDALSVYYMD